MAFWVACPPPEPLLRHDASEVSQKRALSSASLMRSANWASKRLHCGSNPSLCTDGGAPLRSLAPGADPEGLYPPAPYPYFQAAPRMVACTSSTPPALAPLHPPIVIFAGREAPSDSAVPSSGVPRRPSSELQPQCTTPATNSRRGSWMLPPPATPLEGYAYRPCTPKVTVLAVQLYACQPFSLEEKIYRWVVGADFMVPPLEDRPESEDSGTHSAGEEQGGAMCAGPLCTGPLCTGPLRPQLGSRPPPTYDQHISKSRMVELLANEYV